MRVHVYNPRGRPLRELSVATTREHEEELLDEALSESFPASDPPAPFRGPITSMRPKRDPKGSLPLLLNQCLAEAIDAFNHARQAHWDLGGGSVSALHELFDDFARHLEESTDLLANASAQRLGTRENGTELVADEAPADDALETLPQGKSHLDVFATRLSHFRETVHAASDLARQARDEQLMELLVRIGRQVDRDLERLTRASAESKDEP